MNHPYETLPAQGLSMNETPRRRYAFCDGTRIVHIEQGTQDKFLVREMRYVPVGFAPPENVTMVDKISTIGSLGTPVRGDEGPVHCVEVDGHSFLVLNPRCDWDYGKGQPMKPKISNASLGIPANAKNLVLTREEGEGIMVDGPCRVVITQIHGSRASVLIQATPDVAVIRDEIVVNQAPSFSKE